MRPRFPNKSAHEGQHENAPASHVTGQHAETIPALRASYARTKPRFGGRPICHKIKVSGDDGCESGTCSRNQSHLLESHVVDISVQKRAEFEGGARPCGARIMANRGNSTRKSHIPRTRRLFKFDSNTTNSSRSAGSMAERLTTTILPIFKMVDFGIRRFQVRPLGGSCF